MRGGWEGWGRGVRGSTGGREGSGEGGGEGGEEGGEGGGDDSFVIAHLQMAPPKTHLCFANSKVAFSFISLYRGHVHDGN